MHIDSYQGTFDELAEFVTSVWGHDYAGKMSFPLWTADYLHWQFGGPPDQRTALLAAYDGERLAAVLLGLPLPLIVNGQQRRGLLSSWLSVHPEFRGRRLVERLKEEQVRRLTEAGGNLIVSYRYAGSKLSRAAGPTAAQRRDPHWSSRRVGFWVRALDAKRLSRWTCSPVDRWLTRLGSVVLPSPKNKSSRGAIRAYQEQDLPQCLRLLNESPSRSELSIDWTAEQWQRHLLGGGVGRCLVFLQGDEIGGLVTYHVLPFSAKTIEPVAVVDVVAIDRLPSSEQSALLNAALVQMRSENAILAVKLRTGDTPTSAMMRAGFFARPTDSYQMIHWLNESDAAAQRRQRILWR